MSNVYDKSSKTVRRYRYEQRQRLAISGTSARSSPVNAQEVLLHANPTTPTSFVGVAGDGGPLRHGRNVSGTWAVIPRRNHTCDLDKVTNVRGPFRLRKKKAPETPELKW